MTGIPNGRSSVDCGLGIHTRRTGWAFGPIFKVWANAKR
jgi:hypothetical protein